MSSNIEGNGANLRIKVYNINEEDVVERVSFLASILRGNELTASLNLRGHRRVSPLYASVRQKYHHATQILMRYGADITQGSYDHEDTAAHCAAAVGNVTFLSQLRSHLTSDAEFFAAVTKESLIGRSPIDAAALCGQADTLRYLLTLSGQFSGGRRERLLLALTQNEVSRVVTNAAAGGSVVCLDHIIEAAGMNGLTHRYIKPEAFKRAAQLGHIAVLARLCDAALAQPATVLAESSGAQPLDATAMRAVCAAAALSVIDELAPGDPAFATAPALARCVLSRLLSDAEVSVFLSQERGGIVDRLAAAFRANNAPLTSFYLQTASSSQLTVDDDADAGSSDTNPSSAASAAAATAAPSISHTLALNLLCIELRQRGPDPRYGPSAPGQRTFAGDCAYATLDVLLAHAFNTSLAAVCTSEPLQCEIFKAAFTDYHGPSVEGVSSAFASAVQCCATRAAPAVLDLLLALVRSTHFKGQLIPWQRVVNALSGYHAGSARLAVSVPLHPYWEAEYSVSALLDYAAGVSADADARACADAEAGRTLSAFPLPADTGIGPLPHHTDTPCSDLLGWVAFARSTAAPRGALADAPLMRCFPRQKIPRHAPVGAPVATVPTPTATADEHLARRRRFLVYADEAFSAAAPVCPVCLRHTAPATAPAPVAAVAATPPVAVQYAGAFAAAAPARCYPYCESTRMPDDVRLATHLQRLLSLTPTDATRLSLIRPPDNPSALEVHFNHACLFARPNVVWVLLQACPEFATCAQVTRTVVQHLNQGVLSLDNDADQGVDAGPPALGARLGRAVVILRVIKAALGADEWSKLGRELFDPMVCLEQPLLAAALDTSCLPLLRFLCAETACVHDFSGSSLFHRDLRSRFLRETLFLAATRATEASPWGAHRVYPTAVHFLVDSVRRLRTDVPGPVQLARALAQSDPASVAPTPLVRASIFINSWQSSFAVLLALIRAGGSYYCAAGGVTVLHAIMSQLDARSSRFEMGLDTNKLWRTYVYALIIAVRDAEYMRAETVKLVEYTGSSCGCIVA